jgi:hypothetical protein
MLDRLGGTRDHRSMTSEASSSPLSLEPLVSGAKRGRRLIVAGVLTVALIGGASASILALNRQHQPDVRIPRLGEAPGIRLIVPRLHARGLRIAIPHRWSTGSNADLVAWSARPTWGTTVSKGSVVVIQIGNIGGVGGASDGSFVVPTLVGWTLAKAIARLDADYLPWAVDAAPLPPTSTSNLLAAYCVAAQRPRGGIVVHNDVSARKVTTVLLRAAPC